MPLVNSGRVTSGTGKVNFSSMRNQPIWQTPAGRIGFINGGQSYSFILDCIDGGGTDTPRPIAFSIVGGTLPDGLTLTDSGTIQGTPVNRTIEKAFTVRASDGHATADRTFSLSVINERPLWITPEGPLGADLDSGATVALTLLAIDSNHDPVNFRLESGTLPEGLVLDSGTGLISGSAPTPDVETGYSFIVSAIDNNGGVSPRAFVLTVEPPSEAPVWVTPPGLLATFDPAAPAPTIAPLSATSNAGLVVAYYLSEGQLPPGLVIDEVTGEIEGTPVASPRATIYAFTVEATDGVNDPTPQNFTIALGHVNQAPVWRTPGGWLGQASINGPYNFILDAVDPDSGPDMLTYSLTPGSQLPNGFSLNPAGVIIGTTDAAAPDSFNMSIAVTDGVTSVVRLFSLSTISGAPFWITPGGKLRVLSGGVPVSIGLGYADPNHHPLTCSLATGILPPGLLLGPYGVIDGVPNIVADDTVYPFTLRLDDGLGHTTDQSFTITVLRASAPPVWVTPAGLLGRFSMTIPVGLNLLASGSSPGDQVTYSVIAGDLPPGLTLSSFSGALAGLAEPVASDTTFAFTVRADNGRGGVADRQFSIILRHINRAPIWQTPEGSLGTYPMSIPLTPIQLATTDLDNDATAYVIASGSHSASSVSKLRLPSGVLLSTIGILGGTPDPVLRDTNSTFVVAASDGHGGVTNRTFSMTILHVNRPPVWLTPAGSLGTVAMSVTITPLSFAAFDPDLTLVYYTMGDGSLPGGLTFDPQRLTITGAPDPVLVDTEYDFSLLADDHMGGVAAQPFSLLVKHINRPPVWNTPSGNLGTVLMSASMVPIQLLAIDPDVETVHYYAGGNFVPGLTISDSGLIYGTPDPIVADATFSFVVYADDKHRELQFGGQPTLAVTAQSFSLTVQHENRPPVWVTQAGFLGSLVMLASMTPIALHAVDPDRNPVSYAVVAGSLPGSLSLTSDGTISGVTDAVLADTPATFTVAAIDSFGAATPQEFSLLVRHLNRAPVWVTPSGSLGTYPMLSTLPAMIVQASDPDGDMVSYAVGSGSFPQGVGITASGGTISGSPFAVTSNTVYTVTLNALDTNGAATPQTFTMEVDYVNRPPVWTTPAGSLGAATMGNTILPILLNATDPDGGPVVYTFGDGTLAAGLALDPTGFIYGTLASVTADTISQFSADAADAQGNATRQAFSYTVYQKNRPPVWLNPANLGSFPMTASLTLPLLATDPDGDTVVYTFTAGVLPAGTELKQGLLQTFRDAGGIHPLAPVNSDTTSVFEITAYDNNGGVVPQTFSLTVLHVNRAPVWISGTDLGSYTMGDTVAIGLMASDPDGDTVSYMLEGGQSLPPGLTLTSDGAISGIPAAVTDTTRSNFIIDALDGLGGVTPQAFGLTVKRLNRPPTWVTPSFLGAFAMTVTLAIPLLATDPDGDAVSYFGTPTPPLIISSGGIVSGSLPQVLVDTPATFAVSVTDNRSAAVQATFSILIKHVNRAPVWVTAGSLGIFNSGGGVGTIALAATDADGDAVTMALTTGTLPSALVFTPASKAITGTLATVPVDTPYTFTITATDAQGAATPKSFVLVAAQYNAPPVFLNVSANRILLPVMTQNQPYSAVIKATDSDGPSPVIFGLNAGQMLPPGVILDGNGTFSGTPSVIGGPQYASFAYTVVATAYDGKNTVPATLVIPVSPLPTPWDNFTNFGTFTTVIGPGSMPVSVVLDSAPPISTWDNFATFAAFNASFGVGTAPVAVVVPGTVSMGPWENFISFAQSAAVLSTGSTPVAVQVATNTASPWDAIGTFAVSTIGITPGTLVSGYVTITASPWDNVASFGSSVVSIMPGSMISGIQAAPIDSPWDNFNGF